MESDDLMNHQVLHKLSGFFSVERSTFFTQSRIVEFQIIRSLIEPDDSINHQIHLMIDPFKSSDRVKNFKESINIRYS